MSHTNQTRINRATISRYAMLTALVWTIFVVAVVLWNVHFQRTQTFEIAKNQARVSFEKDLVYRRWAAMHGGVYVPATKHTPPNPYLSHMQERDITTPSGRRLTLINPAYMTRQVHELGARQYGFRGHITSLNPLRPGNAPDPWERKVLEGFETNPVEITSLEEIDGKTYMRLMRPMITEPICLKCHAGQGYRAGEIRGGISVSIPMKPLWALTVGELQKTIIGYGVIWFLGIVGISLAGWHIKDRIDQYNQVEREREQLLYKMGERIKELRCMYNVTDSIHRCNTLDELFREVAAMIPPGWQYPRSTRCIIRFDGKEYVSEAFEQTKWSLSSDILVENEKRGEIEVYYLSESSQLDEGPFLDEERVLLDEVARNMGGAIEKKLAQKALRLSEARLKEAQHIGAMGYWEFDVETKQIIWSEELYRLFERSPDQGPPNYEENLAYYVPEDSQRLQEHIHRAIERAEESDEDYQLSLPSGRCAYQRFIIKVDKNIEGQNVKLYGIAQDVTERKQAERELKETHQRLVEAAHKAGMGEVATGILHNVGNVFNSINISANSIRETLLNSRIKNLKKIIDMIDEHTHDLGTFLIEDERGRHIPTYLTEAGRLMVSEQTDMINKLQSLTRGLEHIKQIIQSQQKYARIGGVKVLTSTSEIIEDAVQINKEGLSRHDVILRLELSDLPKIYIDKQRVLQILVNLINNGKYAVSKSQTQEKMLTVRSYLHGESSLCIDVTDNGIGISQENVTKIFQHGFTTKEKGHGFGLHSSALAAQQMGGSLTVHSDGPGHGATFTLELPLTKSGAKADGCNES